MRLTLFFSLFALAGTAGCDRPSYTYSGLVCDSDKELAGSYILTGGIKENYEHPLPGVKVYFARTADGEPISDQLTATTDEQGNYSLTISKEFQGQDLYLIAEKKGYETLSVKPGVGPLSSYLTARIILKKTPGSAPRGAKD